MMYWDKKLDIYRNIFSSMCEMDALPKVTGPTEASTSRLAGVSLHFRQIAYFDTISYCISFPLLKL